MVLVINTSYNKKTAGLFPALLQVLLQQNHEGLKSHVYIMFTEIVDLEEISVLQ